MNTLYIKIKEATTEVHLTLSEKEYLRSAIEAYVAHLPIRTGVTASKAMSHSPLFSIFKSPYLTGALAIAFAVTTGTAGVSYAATDALPGDLLYPVKVRVNEEVKTVFLETDADRIEWERERAELRLEEASQLVKEGRLDAELSNEVLQYFSEHAESVVAQARSVGVEDPFLAAEVTDEFENALDAHEAVLARLTVDQEGVQNTTRDLVTQVHSVALETAKVRDEAEAQIAFENNAPHVETATPTDVQVSVGVESHSKEDAVKRELVPAHMRDQVVYRAEIKSQDRLSHVETLLQAVREDEPVVSEVRVEVELAKQKLAEAKTYTKEGDLGNAYRIYREVANTLQNVGQVLEMHRMFSIEIRPRVDGEEQSHTPEVDIQKLFEETSIAINQARTALITAKGLNDDVYERANTRIKDASASLLRGDIARSLGENTSARNLYKDAQHSAEYVQEILTEGHPEEDVQGAEVIQQVESAQSNNMSDAETPIIRLLSTHTDTIEILTGTVSGLRCAKISSYLLQQSSSTNPAPTLVLESTSYNPIQCKKEVGNTMFTLSSSTPIHARSLRAVVLDGVERPFTIREESSVYGTDTVRSTVDERIHAQEGMFNRVFDAAQGMFSPKP